MADGPAQIPESLRTTSEPSLDSRILRVLIVEDSPDDALLAIRELRKAGHQIVHERVETLPQMRAALRAGRWDVVIADYTLPRFSALDALLELKRADLDIPFLIVSGTIAEETANDAMRAGVHDYIAKTGLARLAPAVERELREVANRRALDRAHRDFRRVIDLFPDGVLIHRAGKIRYVNEALCQALGVESPEQVVDRNLLDFAVPADRKPIQAAISNPTRGTVEVRFNRCDGSEVQCELSAGPVVDFEGEKASVLAVRDVTERNRMRAGLILTDRMASMGTLAAGVAHEINNPLAAVVANLDWISDELSSCEGKEQATIAALRQPLREAQDQAQRVREIVRELKLFSHIEQTRHDPIEVRRMVESSVKLAWNEIRHRARFSADFEEAPAVLGNEGRLGQVVLNLLINAAQAIPEGHADENEIRVVVRTNTAGDAVIEVSDTGCGIAPEVLPRIFDPFFTTKPAGLGTGLGLAICDRIVNEVGGRLTVDSVPGKGSTFRVTLPSAGAKAGRSPVGTVPPTAVPPPPRRGRILVVDDERMMGIALGRTLAREHEVVVLTSAKEAEERYEAGDRFDLIVCDMMMPVMTGMDLQQAIERLAPGHGQRMIFLTGGAFTPRAREFLEHTSNPTLSKPFDARTLRALVNRLLSRDGS